MKLEYNLLREENDNLKSQLDTMCKQSKKNTEFIEKHRKLEVEKQQDVAVQVDLVCVIYVYVMWDYALPKQSSLNDTCRS